jgi:hypothetical protein
MSENPVTLLDKLQEKDFLHFNRYNLAIHEGKWVEIFSTHSHSSLVQFCIVEFLQNDFLFHFCSMN